MKKNIKDLLQQYIATNQTTNNSVGNSVGSGNNNTNSTQANDNIKKAEVVRQVDKITYEVTLIGEDINYIAKTNTSDTNSFLLIPKIGSECLFYSVGSENYISHFSDLDSIELLDDQDFLVKYEPLRDALDILENITDTWQTVFNSWTPAPNDGGAALKSIFTSNSTNLNISLTQFDQLIQDMKNENVKQ